MKRVELIKRRKQLNMTQEEIAKKVGIKRGYYSNIENGRKDPSLSVAKRILEVIDGDMDIFFTIDASERRFSA